MRSNVIDPNGNSWVHFCAFSAQLTIDNFLFIAMQSANHTDTMMLLMAFGYAVITLGSVFFLCEITQRSCDGFNRFDQVIQQTDWYMYPMQLKKLVPIVLIVVQKPVELQCFGGITCDRELFKRVSSYDQSRMLRQTVVTVDPFLQIINKAYSFFMVLQRFSKWMCWIFWLRDGWKENWNTNTWEWERTEQCRLVS